MNDFERVSFGIENLDKLQFDGQDEARITELYEKSTEDRIESNKNKEPIESNRIDEPLPYKESKLESNRIESMGTTKKDLVDSMMEKLQDNQDSRAFHEWTADHLPEPTIMRLLTLTCEAAWVNNKGAYFNRLVKNELRDE